MNPSDAVELRDKPDGGGGSPEPEPAPGPADLESCEGGGVAELALGFCESRAVLEGDAV